MTKEVENVTTKSKSWGETESSSWGEQRSDATPFIASFRKAFPGVDTTGREEFILQMIAAGVIKCPGSSVVEEQWLRGGAEQLCRERDRRLGEEPGTTDRFLAELYGKPRAKMGLDQLYEVVDWLFTDADSPATG